MVTFKVEASWNVMTHAQKPDFFFRRNGRVHLNGRGRQFSRLLAAEVCASALVMLDTPCSEVVRRVLATHSIRQFPLHFPSCASPCAITFQLEFTTTTCGCLYNADWVKQETSVQKSIHHHFHVPDNGLHKISRQCDNTCSVRDSWEITQINIIWIWEFIFLPKIHCIG